MKTKNISLPLALTQSSADFKEAFTSHKRQVDFDLYLTMKNSNTSMQSKASNIPAFDAGWLEA